MIHPISTRCLFTKLQRYLFTDLIMENVSLMLFRRVEVGASRLIDEKRWNAGRANPEEWGVPGVGRSDEGWSVTSLAWPQFAFFNSLPKCLNRR